MTIKTPCTSAATPGAAAPDPTPCCGPHHDPAAIATERNRFFTGKFMTERDFQDEQWYFLSRDRLHQRLLHGWGVVCGLDVVPHDQAGCRSKGWVIVKKGIAIDCYGRTIVLSDDTPVDLSALQQTGAPASSTPLPNKDFLFGIRYGEQGVEPVPVLYDEHGCGRRTTNNRIDEAPTFAWSDADTTGKCWKTPPQADPCQPCQAAGECLTPSCPCGAMVPLALVTALPAATWAITTDRISFDGVSRLPGPLAPQALTHICQMNWRHGKSMTVTDLEAQPGQLAPASVHPGAQNQHGGGQHQPHRKLHMWLTFDRELKPVPHQADHAVGLDAHTFIVQYAQGLHGTRKQLPGAIKVEKAALPGCKHDGSRVTFTLNPHDHPVSEMLKEINCGDPLFLYITLKCDFIQDCKGRAVDGNFLRGTPPTGDGVEGGTFESWFQLTHDSAQQSIQQGQGGGPTT